MDRERNEENGWKSPADRLEENEKMVCKINTKGCMLHEAMAREVGTVRRIGYTMLGLQTAILLAILALVGALAK